MNRGVPWGIRRAGAMRGVFALALAAAPTLAFAAAADLFYERAVMTAAGQRCALFEPQTAAALAAAGAQARSAALRAGASPQQLALVQARARQKAGSIRCDSTDMRTAAARVRSAFDGYARLYRMTYPGDVASWRAERILPEQGLGWRLSQATRFGFDRAVLGLAAARGQGSQLAAGVVFADAAKPYAARLVLRDPLRAPQAYLGDARSGAAVKLPLARRVAPRGATRAYLAQSRSTDTQLSPIAGHPALLLRFPDSAVAALAALDPREAVSVEFLFAGRGADQVRTAYFEVGDFAAAQAFVAVARR